MHARKKVDEHGEGSQVKEWGIFVFLNLFVLIDWVCQSVSMNYLKNTKFPYVVNGTFIFEIIMYTNHSYYARFGHIMSNKYV